MQYRCAPYKTLSIVAVSLLPSSTIRSLQFKSLPRRTLTRMSSTHSSSSSSSSSPPSLPYPRAAVAVTVQSKKRNVPHYLLVQRANPPDQGKWSLPGGKIHVGESTLDAAKRELSEETQLNCNSEQECHWYSYPFMTTDAIVFSSSEKDNDVESNSGRNTTSNSNSGISNSNSNSNSKSSSERKVQFHYVIAQCFAQAPDGLPKVVPSDDAMAAGWFEMDQLTKLERSGDLSQFVITVIERAELLFFQRPTN